MEQIDSRDRPGLTEDQLALGRDIIAEFLGDVGPLFLLDAALTKLHRLGFFDPL